MKNLIILYLAGIMLLTSCGKIVEEITWETQTGSQRLVVEGNITTDLSFHPIRLSLTDEYFSNKMTPACSGASVRVVSSKDTFYYIEDQAQSGMYKAKEAFSGQLNEHYYLIIDLDEEVDYRSEYTASTELVEGISVDSISAELYYNPIQFEEEDSIMVMLIIWGLEPEEKENYYLLTLFRNDSALSDTITDQISFSDWETGYNGEYGMILFLTKDYVPGDTLSIKIQSVPKDYHEFLDGVREISEPGDPFGFSGPPANAVGNIEGGLGFFYAAHVGRGITTVTDVLEIE